MMNKKSFRECISENNNELVIFAADNYAQFPQRESSIASKCDRTLAAAGINDLVVLRGSLDREYHNWLRSLGLGSDLIVEYGENENGMTLSELIISNPDPIINIILETGRKPVYVPWFSSIVENEAANVLGAELFGSTASETLKYNDKASFKNICQELYIPVVEGVTFEMLPENNENYSMMKDVVMGYLQNYSTVIIRGTLGEFGTSLYKTKGNDIDEIYRLISDSGEKVVIIEPFLNVYSSPNDQWVISRDGSYNHLGTRDQMCKDGMVHIGTVNKALISDEHAKYIETVSLKVVKKMSETGYRGVVGIDYIVSDEGVFPVENNARFNGSSYVSLIVKNIEKLNAPIPAWKFMKVNVNPCSFNVLKECLKSSLYDGVKKNSIFPYNCEAISETGSFSLIYLAENTSMFAVLEERLKELVYEAALVI